MLVRSLVAVTLLWAMLAVLSVLPGFVVLQAIAKGQAPPDCRSLFGTAFGASLAGYVALGIITMLSSGAPAEGASSEP